MMLITYSLLGLYILPIVFILGSYFVSDGFHIQSNAVYVADAVSGTFFSLFRDTFGSPLNQVRHQMLLGDEAFVVLHQQSRGRDTLREVSKAQRRSVALNLPVYRGRYPDRAEAMARAYFSGAYTMAEIGAHFGVHYMTVSRL